ncbi:uncharacterized protein [Hyperolius riggenbachi]|uniref:uncharacterized protein n=1 Tax=Hyperolius riggenbachi TaxID=752182 RepID=UPI0035A2F06F
MVLSEVEEILLAGLAMCLMLLACGFRGPPLRHPPMRQQRLRRGRFAALYRDLLANPDKFHKYTQMSVPAFNKLLDLVRSDLSRPDYRFRNSIPPDEKLMVTLRYLATGQSFVSLQSAFRLGKSTISRIVHDTIRVIWRNLRGQYMPFPDRRKWEEIKEVFWNRCKFPNCCGAIDGKRIRVLTPPEGRTKLFSYKRKFSVVLTALADADYNFLYIDVGTCGSSKGFSVSRRTTFFKKMEEGTLDLPPPTPWPGTTEPSYPPVFVADEAFAPSTNLMRPYTSKGLNYTKKIFNYRLKRARRLGECCFGMLTTKWRVLVAPMNVSLANAVAVIRAACVLHNFVRQEDGYRIEDFDGPLMKSVANNLGRSSIEALANRRMLGNYFLSPEGVVPRQENFI